MFAPGKPIAGGEPRASLQPRPYSASSDASVRVGVRCRPVRSDLSGRLALGFHEAKKRVAMLNYDHTFSFVLGPQRTQQEVYTELGQDVVLDFLNGYNASIIAYGITGSGKTHTMFGTDEQPGVIARAAKQIYDSVNAGGPLVNDMPAFTGCEVTIGVSFLEIYQKRVLDLLGADDVSLKVIGSDGSRTVPELTVFPCPNIKDLFRILRQGHQNQHIRTTAANEASSRSHTIFTIYLTVNGRQSKLVLVDLAGAENLKNNALFERASVMMNNPDSITQSMLKDSIIDTSETASINLSLSAITSVIRALNANSKHIPYRESPLTRLLQDSLGGKSKTVVVITVGPEEELANQTMHTLRIAERMHAVVNKIPSTPPPIPQNPPRKSLRYSTMNFPAQNPAVLGSDGLTAPDGFTPLTPHSASQSNITSRSGSMVGGSVGGGGGLAELVRDAVRQEIQRNSINTEEISILRHQMLILAEQNQILSEKIKESPLGSPLPPPIPIPQSPQTSPLGSTSQSIEANQSTNQSIGLPTDLQTANMGLGKDGEMKNGERKKIAELLGDPIAREVARLEKHEHVANSLVDLLEKSVNDSDHVTLSSCLRKISILQKRKSDWWDVKEDPKFVQIIEKVTLNFQAHNDIVSLVEGIFDIKGGNSSVAPTILPALALTSTDPDKQVAPTVAPTSGEVNKSTLMKRGSIPPPTVNGVRRSILGLSRMKDARSLIPRLSKAAWPKPQTLNEARIARQSLKRPSSVAVNSVNSADSVSQDVDRDTETVRVVFGADKMRSEYMKAEPVSPVSSVHITSSPLPTIIRIPNLNLSPDMNSVL